MGDYIRPPRISGVQNGLLYTIAGRFKQLVLPEKYKDLVVRKLHNEMGHINSEKVLYHLRKRFYWPCMQQEVEGYMQLFNE